MFQTINYLTRQYGLNYWTKQYGLIDGSRTALQYKLGDRSRKLFALTLPDFAAYLAARRNGRRVRIHAGPGDQGI